MEYRGWYVVAVAFDALYSINAQLQQWLATQNGIASITSFGNEYRNIFTVITALASFPVIFTGVWLSTLPTSLSILNKTVCWLVFLLSLFPPARILPSEISCYFYPSDDSPAILTEVRSIFWVRFVRLCFVLSCVLRHFSCYIGSDTCFKCSKQRIAVDV